MTGPASALHDVVVPSVGAILAGKYRVESVVGIGGMGVVVAARHLTLGQPVAIKLLAVPGEEGRAEAHSRFLREAQAAAALRSEHVVKIYDVGALESGLPFMVMELLDGADLGALLDADGPMRPEEAVDCVLQACAAIQEAHAAGIIHRDLKPSNLFRTRRSDGTPLIKVLDFGISKSLASSSGPREVTLTSTRSIVGSPYYMSPEQVRDARKVDARSDIWSLGVILHELLTAEPPFSADTFPGVCAAIVADPPKIIRSIRPELPEELERVVLRCLEKDPARRYQHVGELARALLPFSPEAEPGAGSKLWRSVLSGQASPARSLSMFDLESSGVSQRFAFDNTLASPEGSAPSLVSGDTKTQLSAQLPSLEAPPAPRRSKRWTWTLALGGALVALGFTVSRFLAPTALEPTATPSASASPVTTPLVGTLSVDSNPPGADVYDGDVRLGETPLTLTSLSKERTYRFVIRKPGYEEYAFDHTAHEGDVRVHAVLTPRGDTTAPSQEPEPSIELPASPKRSPRSVAPRPKPSAGPAPVESDIRLQR